MDIASIAGTLDLDVRTCRMKPECIRTWIVLLFVILLDFYTDTPLTLPIRFHLVNVLQDCFK